MTCLITGCDLVDVANDRWVHGDLHRSGHNYVFNACLEAGKTAWQNGKVSAEIEQVEFDIGIMPSSQIFKRRGVITFPAAFGCLNAAAMTYLGRLPV